MIEVALQTGFADQSTFPLLKRLIGSRPGQYGGNLRRQASMKNETALGHVLPS